MIATLAASPTALGQGCPPGAFDYGPVLLDVTAELSVLDHYGPSDPLIPLASDYQRAARDVALIQAAIPPLVGQFHGTLWVANELIINTPNPTERELICANLYYQATMYFLMPDWWIVVFPRSVNVPAIAARYLAIPGVKSADPDGYGGFGFCPDRWTYQADAVDTWRWDIHDQHSSGWSCHDLGRWNVSITLEGVVTVNCFANCDNSNTGPILSANDFICFLNRYAAGDPAANCDASIHAPILNAGDFACFLNRYAAGCP